MMGIMVLIMLVMAVMIMMTWHSPNSSIIKENNLVQNMVIILGMSTSMLTMLVTTIMMMITKVMVVMKLTCLYLPNVLDTLSRMHSNHVVSIKSMSFVFVIMSNITKNVSPSKSYRCNNDFECSSYLKWELVHIPSY